VIFHNSVTLIFDLIFLATDHPIAGQLAKWWTLWKWSRLTDESSHTRVIRSADNCLRPVSNYVNSAHLMHMKICTYCREYASFLLASWFFVLTMNHLSYPHISYHQRGII